MRLSESVTKFLDSARLRLAPATLEAYETDLRRFISWALSQAPDSVFSLTPTLIEGYLIALSKRGLNLGTIARRRSAIGELARFGYDRRYWYNNPMTGVSKIRRPKSIPRAFTPEERTLIMGLPLEGVERMLRAFLWFTGFRVTEALTTRVGDVSVEARRIRTRGKGAKERSVPIPVDLVELLKDWILSHTDMHPQSYVFGRGVGRHMNVRAADHVARKWGNRVGIPHVTPHRFRHDYGSRLLERGADIRTIQILMGHENIRTTANYLLVADRKMEDVVDLLSEIERPAVSVDRFLHGGLDDPSA